jgi:hypothetical protein
MRADEAGGAGDRDRWPHRQSAVAPAFARGAPGSDESSA